MTYTCNKNISNCMSVIVPQHIPSIYPIPIMCSGLWFHVTLKKGVSRPHRDMTGMMVAWDNSTNLGISMAMDVPQVRWMAFVRENSHLEMEDDRG